MLAIVVIALLLRDFLPSYVKEKGKNLATKEDVGHITREIEAVKSQYSHQTEFLKASLQSRGRILDVRYQREFDLLEQLAEHVVSIRDAAVALRPVMDYTTPGESDEDRRRRRLEAYSDAASAFYRFAEAKRPFFPEAIYAAARELLVEARKEAIDYAYGKPEGMAYWNEAKDNAEKIGKLAEETMLAIRDRARVWELPEEGPSG